MTIQVNKTLLRLIKEAIESQFIIRFPHLYLKSQKYVACIVEEKRQDDVAYRVSFFDANVAQEFTLLVSQIPEVYHHRIKIYLE